MGRLPKSCDRSRSAPSPYSSPIQVRNRPPRVYQLLARGHSKVRLESWSMRGNRPDSASARAAISSVEARTRPAALTSLSAITAIPSMTQGGWAPLGIQIFPKMELAAAGTPSTVSRWRMCVYS